MDSKWKDEFAPHILARGKKYFEEGRVSVGVRYGNRITAQVMGEKEYCVEIDLPGGVPDSWLCTCPYAVKGNCKHKAAVLFAIEAGNYVFSDEDFSDETVDLPWREAIKNLPEELLRKELLMDTRNTRLQERLTIHYLGEAPKGMLSDWKRWLRNYQRYAMIGRETITEEDVQEYLDTLAGVIEDRVFLLMDVEATLDAFYLLGAVYEAAVKGVVEDPGAILLPFTMWCENLWGVLVDDASEEQQEQLLHWFWNKRDLLFKNASSASDVYFLNFNWTDNTKRKFLDLVDEWIPRYSECKELELIIDCRIEMMEKLACTEDEILDFMKKNLRFNCVRHWLLTVLDARGEDDKIISLLKNLCEIDEDDLPRLIHDRVWLAKMYERTGAGKEYIDLVKNIMTECKRKLELEIPNTMTTASAKRFVACLNALRELEEKEIPQIIDSMVNRVCSNPAIARKGIVEIFLAAGYEWPKSYRFSD